MNATQDTRRHAKNRSSAFMLQKHPKPLFFDDGELDPNMMVELIAVDTRRKRNSASTPFPFPCLLLLGRPERMCLALPVVSRHAQINLPTSP